MTGVIWAQVVQGVEIIKYGLLSKQYVVDRFSQIEDLAGFTEAHGAAIMQEAMAPFGHAGIITPPTPARRIMFQRTSTNIIMATKYPPLRAVVALWPAIYTRVLPS